MRLKHKTCIVTGAAQGIGLATALKFAEEGANVVVADLKPEGVDAAVALVRARGAQALGFALNVTDREALEHMAAAVKERFDGIDVLVNNAGITKDARLQKMSLQQFDSVIDVNLRGEHIPTSLYYRADQLVNGRPSWWCAEAAPFGAIGAHFDDLTAPETITAARIIGRREPCTRP